MKRKLAPEALPDFNRPMSLREILMQDPHYMPEPNYEILRDPEFQEKGRQLMIEMQAQWEEEDRQKLLGQKSAPPP